MILLASVPHDALVVTIVIAIPGSEPLAPAFNSALAPFFHCPFLAASHTAVKPAAPNVFLLPF